MIKNRTIASLKMSNMVLSGAIGKSKQCISRPEIIASSQVINSLTYYWSTLAKAHYDVYKVLVSGVV